MFAFTMTDSSNRKPPPPAALKRRFQSQDERDAEGLAARKEREAAAPEFSIEEYTDKHDGDELEKLRDTRPPLDRIRRLERKHDEVRADLKDVRSDVKELSGHVSDLRADVAGAVGKIDGQEGVLSEMLSIVKKTAERDHVTFAAKIEVDKAQELAKTEVALATELAKVEVTKEKQLDVYAARRARRKAVLKALGFASGGAGILELLHRLGVL